MTARVNSFLMVPACTDSRPLKEAALLQTLLNLASPQTARYVGHALRSDHTYRVVVRRANEFRTLTVSALALSLVESGILVEQDRAWISQQLA